MLPNAEPGQPGRIANKFFSQLEVEAGVILQCPGILQKKVVPFLHNRFINLLQKLLENNNK